MPFGYKNNEMPFHELCRLIYEGFGEDSVFRFIRAQKSVGLLVDITSGVCQACNTIVFIHDGDCLACGSIASITKRCEGCNKVTKVRKTYKSVDKHHYYYCERCAE